MAYVESYPVISTTELRRWSACALAVLAAHAAAVLAISLRGDNVEFESGAPAILIELAPVAVAPPAPPSELAPGPLEPQAEEVPTQMTEATREVQAEPEVKSDPLKTIAENPTVVVPPEVLKPSTEPRQHQAEPDPSQAAPVPTAPQSSALPGPRPAAPAPGPATRRASEAIVSWQRSLVAHLERFKRYPTQAHGEDGTASVAFSIDRHGELTNLRIIRSSGSGVLDAETLSMVKRAVPLPSPPADLADDQLTFVVPIRYAASR